MTNPGRKTIILLLSGRTRPLRSHYWLCSSFYPQGNPMHWDSRLDHHQTQEWVLNQWNVCFYLSASPLLIKSQFQVEVETRDHINLFFIVFMKHFQSKRGIDLNREGELRAHATYSPSPNEEKTGYRGSFSGMWFRLVRRGDMKKYRAGSPGRGAARETKAFKSFPLTAT